MGSFFSSQQSNCKIRNNIETQMTKIRNIKKHKYFRCSMFGTLENSNFEFASDFVFRYSNFTGYRLLDTDYQINEGGGTRTHNLRLKRALLYQLSYSPSPRITQITRIFNPQSAIRNQITFPLLLYFFLRGLCRFSFHAHRSVSGLPLCIALRRLR